MGNQQLFRLDVNNGSAVRGVGSFQEVLAREERVVRFDRFDDLEGKPKQNDDYHDQCHDGPTVRGVLLLVVVGQVDRLRELVLPFDELFATFLFLYLVLLHKFL